MPNVAIIGAGGAAGLVSCKEAKSMGMQVTGFESNNRIGGTWSTDSNPISSRGHCPSGLMTNISRFSGVFPDFPWTEITPVFPNTQDMFDYLNAYAEHFKIKEDIQFESRVVKAFWEGNQWIIQWTRNDILHKKSFDVLIVATGKYSKPLIPFFQGLDQIPEEKKSHSSNFQTNTSFANKRVLVVGGSISGTDIAEKVANSATQVIHLFRRPRWVLKRKIPDSTGRIVPWDIADTYRMNARTLSSEEQFRNLSELCQLQQKFPEWRMTQKKLSGVVFADTYFEKVEEKKIIPVKSEIDHFTLKSVMLKNKQMFQFDKVIFCTGYETDTSFLPKHMWISSNKTCLYLDMFPLDSSKIAFVGMNSANRFSILAQQAEFACHIFSGKGMLPSYEEMRNAIKNTPALAPVDYINTLAKQAGSFTDTKQLRLTNPILYRILKTIPFLPSQNKLTGPYSNPAVATEIIYDADKYLRSIPPLENRLFFFADKSPKSKSQQINLKPNTLRSKL